MSDKTTPGHIVPGSKGMTKNITDTKGKAESSPINQINISEQELSEAVRLTRDRADMNQEMITMIPELKQAQAIINSSIVSPNDFSKKEILVEYVNRFNFSDTIVSKLKALGELSVKKHKLVEDLYPICDNTLWVSGADAEVIIPRTMVEYLIGSSIENLNKSPYTSKADLESFIESTSSNAKTLDNIGAISLDLTEKSIIEIQKDKVKTNHELTLESFNVSYSADPISLVSNIIYDEVLKNKSEHDYYFNTSKLDAEAIDPKILGVYDKYKKSTNVKVIDLSNIDAKSSKSDSPFRLKVNASCVLPIFTNDKSDHIFYLLVADELNRSITNIPSDKEIFNSIRNYSATDGSAVLKQIVDKANENLSAGNDTSLVISNMLGVAETVLLNSVKKTIKNSIYRNTANIENENSLIRIILYRALTNMKTKILFVPKEYMSYIAFEYRKNGTGKTLLEDITVLASFKAMLTLSEIYSAIDNNIPTTDVKVTLDDDDPEPEKSKEKIEQSIYNSNRKMLWGETSLERHGLFIQNSNLRVFFEHKTFPNTTMQIEKKNKESSYTPDTTASDKVTSMILKSIGLSPTILNEAENIEFASVASISNALTNKVNNGRQDIMSEGITDRNMKLMLSDAAIMRTAYSILESNKSTIITAINDSLDEEDDKITDIPEYLKREIVKDMLDGISLRLPRAESKDNYELRDKFKGFKDSIDEVMDTYLDSSYIDDVVAELGITKENIINNIKLILISQWCEEHNYATYMSKFMGLKDNKELRRLSDLINQKDSNLIDLAKATSKHKEKVLSKLKPAEGTEDDKDAVDDFGNPIAPSTENPETPPDEVDTPDTPDELSEPTDVPPEEGNTDELDDLKLSEEVQSTEDDTTNDKAKTGEDGFVDID